jgi:hypothetical protein
MPNLAMHQSYGCAEEQTRSGSVFTHQEFAQKKLNENGRKAYEDALRSAK